MLRVPRRVRAFGRDRDPFRTCGLAGLAAAVAVALALAAGRDLSLTIEAALIATAVCVFLVLALAARAATGRETLVYYHHEIAVLASVAGVAAILGAPVLDHLDATALGLGAFLALGRVGCLLAGCCHGRPADHGVAYGPERLAEGFPAYLIDVPLVPVQALEAAGAAMLVAIGATLVPATPGAAFGWYVTGYALLRFALELLRGDPVRRYWRGLSEAQWTSLLVVAVMCALAAAGALPGAVEHLGAFALLAGAAAITLARRPRSLLHPRHVRELAALLPAPRDGRATVVTTSLGVQLSAGRSHYTLSAASGELTQRDAAELARVIAWLGSVPGAVDLVPGAAGAYHLIVARSPGSKPAS